MDTENEITELFDSATRDLHPPIEEMFQQSTVLGKRLRRRRDARIMLGTAGVLAVAIGTAVVLPQAGQGPSHAVSLATSGPSTYQTPSPTMTPTPSLSPTAVVSSPVTPTTAPTTPPTGTPTGSANSGSAALQLFKSLLPTGGTITKVFQNSYASAEIWYDDGHGAVDMAVTTTSDAFYTREDGTRSCAGWIGGTDEGPRPPGALQPSCTTETLPDGATELDVVTGVDGSGFYDLEVTLFRTDGFIVEMNEGNGKPMGATVDVTRAVPPLTMAQVQAIVADPRWRLY